jgi:pyruvate dehydrogenase E1 component beta subunit
MPATVLDARDLLVSAALCGDPVLYVDDRWLYHRTADLPARPDPEAIFRGPRLLRSGGDITLVGAGWATMLVEEAAEQLAREAMDADVIDLRVINPLDITPVVESVQRTGRLVVVDGGWTTCGLAGEVIAAVAERVEPEVLRASPRRVTLQDAPAPTSGPLEAGYYPTVERICRAVREALEATPRPL